MTDCLYTKKSNCKNCYKCIRNCPVKSIRFTDNQASIVSEECVLCGKCYVSCPQDAKQIRRDGEAVKELIESGREVYASLAPSFIANYPNATMNSMKNALKKLGFQDASETAIGATIVKKKYENMIARREKRVILSSCCHTVNTLIQRHYPNAIMYLANVISPMQAHAMLLKKKHEGCATVFIGPCISKKAEADKYKGIVDYALTFEELDGWLLQENIIIEQNIEDISRGRTRSFPTSGGIICSMDKDPDYQYVIVDGMDNCINTLKDIDNGDLTNCFIEMSACSGSCVGGPVMSKTNRNPIKDFLTINKATDKDDFKVEMLKESSLKKEFNLEGFTKAIPGSHAIDEILKKMGKSSKEQELNCGSCGYNTCRDKAVAVLTGKADLTMCLPFLKEKAESFSDTIINNTLNGIMVLDEQLNVQQMNKAARNIINLKDINNIIGGPVVRILDPTDYVTALNRGENIYEKQKYLAEYKKYIEETIIYDKEYHIIISILKDITNEQETKAIKENQCKATIEITDKVIEKQMRVVQEIASLLGETTAETKIALTRLKETLSDE